MTADVATNLDSWSTTESSNLPTGATTISTNLDDNLRQIQATVRKYLANKGADIASAATVDLSTATGNYVEITGTTTITGFGTLTAGMWKILRIKSGLTITHSANLYLPDGVSYNLRADDFLLAVSVGGGAWVVPFIHNHWFNTTIFRIKAAGDFTKTLAFDLNSITTGTERTLTVPNASGTIALTSSEFPDTTALRVGSSDATKKAAIEVDGLTTANTRTGTWPNYDFRFMTQTHGADVASASTVDLDTATGDLVDVTGTTTITAITLADGREATVRFTGALTLTHNASIILPGGKSITTVAGDMATFKGYAAGVVRCSQYQMYPGIISETAVASTSGATINFTSIPSGVKRITVMVSGLSTNGTSLPIVQIGDSGGLETTGYAGGTSNAGEAAIGSLSSGLNIWSSSWGGTHVIYGTMTLSLMDSATNTWAANGTFGSTAPSDSIHAIAGTKALTGTLDRLTITTAGGVNTFDAGLVNITYER